MPVTSPPLSPALAPVERQIIRRRLQLRFGFSAIVCVLYGGFALGYGPLRELFAKTVTATSPVVFALAYFVFLIVLFLLLEFIYLRLADKSTAIGRNTRADEAAAYADR
ncbi:hypothetical protein FKG94_04865 [Exilibacterium tricleocarpae]|uniref:DUF485 domain-containing protein n=1 Tax=Exilibacterium tricleocarpae TaxID=2591008 RepID=A0A545U3F2_9GAMM|nr:hypothetical protein [Exilibacterium tricleocarpae]TQV84001.1 hypothetical protein FKG94_04865 [Exilibacterium tricleocarpae]